MSIKMVYDTDFRECVVPDDDVAAPMIEQGADSPGAFVVPTTASRITEIRIGLGSVSAAQDAVLSCTSAVHISGSGITLGEGWFAGPMHVESGAAATSAGYAWETPMIYKTNIPVKGGGLFNADAWIFGEDLADAHMILGITYDGQPGQIVDSDIREIGTVGTAANTLYTLNYRGGANAGDFRPGYSVIKEIVVGSAPDVAGGNVGLNIMPTFHLSGAGLVAAGNYKFLGNTGYTLGDTDISGPGATTNLTRYTGCNISIKRGDSIRVQAQNIESIQISNAIVGLLF